MNTLVETPRSESTVHEPFVVSLEVTIRPCREEDLSTLEWFGMFTPHRELIRGTFERQQRGEAMMLVAEANGVASGQLWIELGPPGGRRVATIWAVRVFPCLQGLGIGARLVRCAERLLRGEGFEWAELTVEPDNHRARRFYERCGYEEVDEAAGPGARRRLRKRLGLRRAVAERR